LPESEPAPVHEADFFAVQGEAALGGGSERHEARVGRRASGAAAVATQFKPDWRTPVLTMVHSAASFRPMKEPRTTHESVALGTGHWAPEELQLQH
jgi:hypothetical protein